MYNNHLIGWVLDNYIDIGSGKLCQHSRIGAEKTRSKTHNNPFETQTIELADVNQGISKLNPNYPQAWSEYSKDIESNYHNKISHNLTLAQWACVRHITGNEVILPGLSNRLRDIINGTEASPGEQERA